MDEFVELLVAVTLVGLNASKETMGREGVELDELWFQSKGNL